MPKLKKYTRQHINRKIGGYVNDQLLLIHHDSSQNTHIANENSEKVLASQTHSSQPSTSQTCTLQPSTSQMCTSQPTFEFMDNTTINAYAEYPSASISESSSDSDTICSINIPVTQKVTFSEDIRDWAVKYNIPQNALSHLLAIHQKHNIDVDLPKDARSLLKTPRKILISSIEGGEYLHIGMKNNILKILNGMNGVEYDKIILFFNVDGLPLSKSSSSQLWPILVKVKISNMTEIFPAGIFFGKQKPVSAEEFLIHFIDELNSLIIEGILFRDKKIPVELKGIVCDAPARSFLTNTKGHTGYFGCPRCITEGDHINDRMCYPEINAAKRTNDSFRKKLQKGHHLGNSCLEQIGSLDIVTQIPFDYMHLICLGVVRKLLKIWLRGKLRYRLPSRKVNQISEQLEKIKCYVPKEFARKPRSLKYLDRWKATEFRQFILYTGPVILKDILDPEIYLNFMTLHCATFILSHKILCHSLNSKAEELMKSFVLMFEILYGRELISYNVHGLIHLAEDVRNFGDLEEFSAFGFENFLQKLKKLIRKPEKPLHQINNRLHEILNAGIKNIQYIERDSMKFVGECHREILLQRCCRPQFREIHFNNFIITVKPPDNCCLLNDGSIVLVHDICHANDNPVIVGCSFDMKVNFYSLPCNSTILNIYKVSSLSSLRIWDVKYIIGKCFALQNFKDDWIVFPLLHTI